MFPNKNDKDKKKLKASEVLGESLSVSQNMLCKSLAKSGMCSLSLLTQSVCVN